jgi:Domain of unknown function (DUF5666)
MKNLSTVLAAAITAAFAIGLSSCNQTPAAIGATQTVAGTISAMSADRSSVTVAGQTLKLVSAAPALSGTTQTRAYWKGHVKVNGSSASVNALSVGQSVSVKASNDGEANEVEVDLEVKGAISSIATDGKSLTVAGKTILVNANTRYDLSGDDDHAPISNHTLADLKAGDFVEVTGATDAATGNVLASKIEVKNASELGEDGEDNDSELKGSVSGLTADSFSLGAVTVHCVAPCVLPTGLKNGDMVEAEGTLTGSNLEAKKVKLENEMQDHPAAGSSITLSKDVNHLNAGAKTFDLGRYSVEYAGATVTGTLANDAVVKVEGKVDATNTKLVHATSVTILSSGEHGGNGGNDDGSGHK